MRILRLSTLLMTLALGVLALGYVNPSFAGKPVKCDPWPSCKDDSGGGGDPSDLTYTVDLVGPDPATPSFRGAFEFDGAGGSATLDRGALKITGAVTMTRPGDDIVDNEDCTVDGSLACVVWNDVFNLCRLLGPYDIKDGGGPDDDSMPTNLNTFTVLSGDWSVNQGGGRRWIGFGFTIDQSFSDLTDRNLSASLQLTSDCFDPVNNPSCDHEEDPPFLPTVAGGITYTAVTEARIHLRGKGGVTHNADCHADVDELILSGSTVVITATSQ